MMCFLFAGLSSDEINRILQKAYRPKHFDRGDELYKYGHIGIVLKGTAKIMRRNNLGITVTMRTIGDGELFGAASVFGEWKENSSSIIAVIPCDIIYISEEQLRCIFAENPLVAFNYISFLSDRIRFLNRKIDTFSADSTEERLYEYLLSCSDKNGNVILEFGMAELARRLKIGRTSLYRSIEALEKGGLIKRNKNNFTVY